MPRGSKTDPTESGVLVYPKLPVPEQRARSEPRGVKPKRPLASKTLYAIAAGGVLTGAVAGFLLRPALAPDKRVSAFETQATEATKAAEVQKQRADELDGRVSAAAAKEKDLRAELEVAKRAQGQLADKTKDSEKKAKEADAAQAKLKA